MSGKPNAKSDDISNQDLEMYFEIIEEFPDDIVKIISSYKESDAKAFKVLSQIEDISSKITKAPITKQKKCKEELRTLITAYEELSIEKLEYATSINSMIKAKVQNFNFVMTQKEHPEEEEVTYHEVLEVVKLPEQTNQLPEPPNKTEVPVEVKVEKIKGRRGRKPKALKDDCNLMMLADIATKKRRNKKVKVKEDKEEHEESETGESQQEGERAEVSTNETVYCNCSSDSCTGPMILCDNEACSIEWFHFNCVGLKRPPKGKWYCPKCRSKKVNVLKKELVAKKLPITKYHISF